ncbi:MAG: aminotransferase class I/II-fold pyridoxal phosphate-dependent enzyme [Nitrospirota bacterium]|nr:aminotransferase class I/II-fold pyridoxal phosphate-dependent enzyme [Nitrospirota bacterium]
MKKDRIDDSFGISPVGPSKKIKASIRKAVKSINEHPTAGLTRLNRLFSSKFGIQEEGILLAGSMEELIYLIPSVFRPERVLVLGPAPDIYGDASSAAGAEVSYLNTDEKSGFSADTGEIKEKLKGIDLLFISNPNRITGRLIDRKSLYPALSVAMEKKTCIVLDESLIEFTGDDDYYENLSKSNRLIVIRTTANFYGLQGLELAWAVTSPETASVLKKHIHWRINNLAVEAARTALRDDAYRRLAIKHINDEKRLLLNAFKKLACVKIYHSDANILLLKLESNWEKIAGALSESGISIKNCADIVGLDSSYLRLSVMKHESNLKFIRILTRLVKNLTNRDA